MKKILLSLSILFSLNCYSEINLHFDTSKGLSYVNVEPVLWIRNKPKITRLYINALSDNLINSGIVEWRVMDSVYIDPDTTLRTFIDNGTFTLTASEYEQWDPSSVFLFNLAAEKLRLTIKD